MPASSKTWRGSASVRTRSGEWPFKATFKVLKSHIEGYMTARRILMPHPQRKQRDLARELAPILDDPANVEAMVALSRRGRPAVEAIGAAVAQVRPDLVKTGKQHVGRLVHDRLAARGLKPMRPARVRPGNLFSWGALVYGGAGADRVRQKLSESGIGTVNLAEAAGRFARGGLPPESVEVLLERIPCAVIPPDRRTALLAGQWPPIVQRAGLSLGDRFCLALAKETNTVALTTDRRWSAVAGLIGVQIELVR